MNNTRAAEQGERGRLDEAFDGVRAIRHFGGSLAST
jgi:hypothetical protein